MFVTSEQVKKYTGYDVDLSDINIAQAMIEAYIGRGESRVSDADDLEVLGLATAYQTVYIKSDPNRVFEQAATKSISQDTSSINFNMDMDSPFIAPLAMLSMRNLSWRKSRSVQIGPITAKTVTFNWKQV